MKFATVRLGKTSVNDIRKLASMPQGVVADAMTIDVVCTQVPEDLSEGTVVFVWLGSDNSKGAPTDWIQGFKVVGLVSGIKRGTKYNDESTTTLSLKYAFNESITRLDVLRDCPEAYYWCSSLPVIGLDDHSNQTIRCISADSERAEIGAFLYSLEAVRHGFRNDIVSILPEIDDYFWDSVKSPKSGDFPSARITLGTYSRLDILAAIRAKPFILLAGMSGTGKTRIVRQLARGCCPAGSDLAKDPDHPGNYECIPVRPNWHDSTGLMGYVSRIDGAKYVVTDFVRFLAKAWLYEEEGIPFFLCLDEMNLAPVEQYFAEYLSVIESRRVKDGKIVSDPLVRIADEGLLKAAIDVVYKGVKHETAEKFKAFFVLQGGIPIPSNLVVMGTVNMDETTCSFPHKVLDRAMTFELNEFDIDSGLESNPDTPLGSIKVENAKGTFTHGWQVYAEAKDVCDKIKPYLVSVNAVLNGTKFKFAYRTRDEVMAYCVERMKDGTALVAALGEATSMKVLSRVEGDEQIVKRTWLEKLQTAIADGLKALCAEGEEPPKKCADKLAEMHRRLVDTGFTSFWA